MGGCEAKKCDRFKIKRGLRQEYKMSPWLFNISIDGALRKQRVMFVGRRIQMIKNDVV